MWHTLPAFCPKCGFKFRSGVVGEQFAQLVVVQRQPTSSGIGKCPRCGAQGQLEPWLDEAIDMVVSPTRPTEARSELISVLSEGGQDDKSLDEQIDKRVPMFMRLKRVLPKDRTERIAVASLLVAMASLANDIYSNATSDSVTTTQLERVLRSLRSLRNRRMVENREVRTVRLFEYHDSPRPGYFKEIRDKTLHHLVDGDSQTSWASPMYAIENEHTDYKFILYIGFFRAVKLTAVTIRNTDGFYNEYRLWTSSDDQNTPSESFLRTFLNPEATLRFSPNPDEMTIGLGKAEPVYQLAMALRIEAIPSEYRRGPNIGTQLDELIFHESQ